MEKSIDGLYAPGPGTNGLLVLRSLPFIEYIGPDEFRTVDGYSPGPGVESFNVQDSLSDFGKLYRSYEILGELSDIDGE